MKKVQFKTYSLLAALLLGGCTGDAADRPDTDGFRFPERPNIVLVLVDTLRRDHVGIYGYPRPTTPFLDRLAAEGLIADNAWAQAPQTFISTATLMCSRYFPVLAYNDRYRAIPGLARDLQAKHALVPYVHAVNLTLAEVLAEAGYETFAAFTNPHHHASSGFWQGFDRAVYVESESRHRPYGRGVDVHARFFEWLDARADTRPFFAYLHLMEVHNPYMPPRRLQQLFVEEPGKRIYTNGRPEEVPKAVDLAYTKALYDGEIRFTDGILESLVDELRSRGLWDRTLFVMTSDHGDEFMEHGGLGHGRTVYQELLRIPLLLAGAGLAAHPAAGGRIEGVVRNLDLAPTLVELVGAAVPESFEGTSLAGILRRGPLVMPADTLAYVGSPPLQSLTDGRWHLAIDASRSARELFDLATDPVEQTDMATQQPRIVRRFARWMAEREEERRAVEAAARGLKASEDTIDPETIEQLEALGYLGN